MQKFDLKMWLFKCFVLIYVIFLKPSNCLYEDDPCILNTSGQIGKCLLLSNCLTALEDIQEKEIFPQICGFQGTLLIVCCSQKSSLTPLATTPDETITPNSEVANSTTSSFSETNITYKANVAESKSKQKCKEYSKYVFEEQYSFVLVTNSKVKADTCAVKALELIVGGEKAAPREFPHMALIGFDEDGEKVWKCGGSLISERYILTAAHCLTDGHSDAKYIRLGDLNIGKSNEDAQPQNFDIIKRIQHPNYSLPSVQHDIALLKLDRPATLNKYVRPACLYTSSEISSDKAIATGWGYTEFSRKISNELMKVTLEAFSHETCIKTFAQLGIDDKTQTCWGSRTEAKDTCKGDSGRPLQIGSRDFYCMYEIIGITSLGKGCGHVNVPAVYTRVSNYVDWLEGIVWNNIYNTFINDIIRMNGFSLEHLLFITVIVGINGQIGVGHQNFHYPGIEAFNCETNQSPVGSDVSVIICEEKRSDRIMKPIVHPQTSPHQRQDSCRLPNGNRGECRALVQCPKAAQLFAQGVHPVVCGRTGTEVYVCCEIHHYPSPPVATEIDFLGQSRAFANGEIGRRCRLANGKRGDCRPLVRCPNVALLYSEGIQPLVCGVRGSEILVCCDSNSPLPFNPPAPPSASFGEQCHFPNGQEGICSPTVDCPTQYQWFPQVYCGTPQPEKVCCHLSSTAAPLKLSSTTSAPTSTTPNLLPDEPCKASDGQNGICTFTFKCPSVLQDVRAGIKPQICGHQGPDVLVCCKIESKNPIQTVPRMTLNSTSQQKCVEYHEQTEKFMESKIGMSELFVVGGVPSAEKEFPHMAALGYGSTKTVKWLCGGSLISPNFILTAAHCTHSTELGPVKFARMGLLNLNKINDNLQDFVVIEIHRHPDYRPPINYNDIALLKLNKNADFTDYVKPACLYTSHDLPTTKPYATGWGKTQFNGESSDVLQKVDLSYYSYEKCRDAFATVSKIKLPNGIVDESHVCAGGINEEKDTCNGDSGGPLQSKIVLGNNEPYYIIGITSFGKACGIANTPAVYTRVSFFVPWIEKIVWPDG
ncbi:uncharacterized protein LOC108736795 [Agrilus planipennis]|uniref:Uncharacterized protein LOC108736795 n=1 Tax=Agrilus planipennis TaxID=224129 RepID=A0A7F5RHC2_AGRPL|nr:uncharacterized protein LOC108736795 [Agrilus planipennis]